jgi:shikimate kinase
MILSTKIFLIGMPGSGKSTLGKELAIVLNSRFIDLDEEIENLEKRTIAQIFSNEDEEYFRKVENNCLLKINDSKESFVMATGGGTPCYYDAIETMLENGTVIFINVPVEELIKRLNNTELKNRPKLNTTPLDTTVNETYESRKYIYKKATITISGSEITASQLLTAISN